MAIARINAYLQEHITGHRGAAAFQPRAQQPGGVRRRSTATHMDAYKDAITAYGWFYPVVEFSPMLALARILTYGGFRVQSAAR